LSVTDFWKLLAGLGLFLYGMFHLEDSMRQMEGRTFKLFLQKHTKKKLSAIFSGTLVTGILQSSSIVNLMVLSFVGAGMLSMRNAMGVVIGANVGGTFNSWLVAFLGFKADLGEFTLPFIGLAGIGLIVFRKQKTVYHISKFLMGFGLLFLGLDYMKLSMETMIAGFDFRPFLLYPRIVFVLIGFVITALIQTSAATVVIVLSALFAKIIPIETAVAVVLGAELGTTIKIVLGSIGGIASKKRVALGNSLFNIVTSLFGFILLVPIISLLRDGMGINDPILILVAFQTFINIAGVIIFYFFLDKFGDFLETRFTDTAHNATFFLQNTSPEIADNAIEMLEKEIGLFIHRVISLNSKVFQIENQYLNNPYHSFLTKKRFLSGTLSLEEEYKFLKQAEGEILTFYVKMTTQDIGNANHIHVNQLIASLRNAMFSAKAMMDVNDDRIEFSNSANAFKYGNYQLLRLQLEDFYSQLNQLFIDETKSQSFEILVKLMNQIKLEYENRMSESYRNAGKNVLKEEDISTLFNANRELYASCKALIFASKDYLLNAERAEAFENIPTSVYR